MIISNKAIYYKLKELIGKEFREEQIRNAFIGYEYEGETEIHIQDVGHLPSFQKLAMFEHQNATEYYFKISGDGIILDIETYPELS